MHRKLLLLIFSVLLIAEAGWLLLDRHLAAQDVYPSEYLTGMILASVWNPGDGQLIRVNLHNHSISTYEDGQPVRQGFIAGAGNPLDWTDTPTGKYRILSKERMHISRLSGVLMPLSMRFFQGYYFHSIPLTPDGFPIRTRYSHGCIRLPNDFSEWLYGWTRVGADVQVYRATLARVIGDQRIYLLTDDGARRPIMTEAAFTGGGYRWQDVAVLPASELIGLTIGEPIY